MPTVAGASIEGAARPVLLQPPTGFDELAIGHASTVPRTRDVLPPPARVPTPRNRPWVGVCALDVDFGTETRRTTGWILAPRAVVTARHVIDSPLLRQVMVSPGRGMGQPGAAQRLTNTWRPAANGLDCAVLVLDQPLTVTPLQVVRPDWNPHGHQAHVSGYMNSDGGRDQWQVEPTLRLVSDLALGYSAATETGHSGSPVRLAQFPELVVGIHTSELGALRINQAVYAQLREWFFAFGGSATDVSRDVSTDALARIGEGAGEFRLTPSDEMNMAIKDGRYRGGNHEISVDLRVDCDVCGVISGDISRVLARERSYVASFRTTPGARAAIGEGRWLVIGQDEHDRRAQGTLELQAVSGGTGVTATLVFDSPLEGLPTRRPILFVAERAAAELRTLGLELEVEKDVEIPKGHTVGGQAMTIESALQQAGIETVATGLSDRIPTPTTPWDSAQLHALMSDFAQASLLQRTWEIHLLLLSRSNLAGLLGIMFDSADTLPRQGVAVFAEEIRGLQGVDYDRKVLQTTVHELGHALNLAHRFERVVGRADSLSFMNYDWRYRGGNRSAEFWSRFTFNFDRDELEFLRHAPLAALIPGGAPFHSINYWADGDGGYSPYVPEFPLPDWELTMHLPANGPVFGFAQPIVLGLELTNKSKRTVTVPKFLLDPKAGFIEVLVQRVNAGAIGRSPSGSQAFVPAVQRCFQWDAADASVLAPGKSMSGNVNLTFGSGGFTFAEPGSYELTALLVLSNENQSAEFVAKSPSVRIRVATPKTGDEERDALEFFTPEVGMYLTLGGSDAMPHAEQVLEEIVDRRKKDVKDPLVTYVMRAQAIDATRDYVRYQNGKFTTRSPQLEKARDLMAAVLKSGHKNLDLVTKAGDTELLKRCQKLTSAS